MTQLQDEWQTFPYAVFGGMEGAGEPTYRWLLTREVHPMGEGTVSFCMLNPSTATAEVDDPTIRRCIRFARDWGYRYLYIVNMFAYRATDPKELRKTGDPVGNFNFRYIKGAAERSTTFVVAWGTNADPTMQDALLEALRPHRPKHLGLTKEGYPRHPLYVLANTKLTDWNYEGEN